MLICAVPDPRPAPLEPIKTAVLAREFGKFEARCVPSCRGSYPLRYHTCAAVMAQAEPWRACAPLPSGPVPLGAAPSRTRSMSGYSGYCEYSGYSGYHGAM